VPGRGRLEGVVIAADAGEEAAGIIAVGQQLAIRGCDLFRYFPSIDHAILKAEFRHRIACNGTLTLMDAIVDGSNPQASAFRWAP
jgi:hypothetical protein